MIPTLSNDEVLELEKTGMYKGIRYLNFPIDCYGMNLDFEENGSEIGRIDIRWDEVKGVWTTSNKQVEVESTLSNKTKSSIDSFNEYFRKNKATGIVAGSGVLRWYNPLAEVTLDNEMSQGSHIKQCGCTTEQLVKGGCICGGC